MHKLIFATNNQHKVDEVKSLVIDLFEVQSLQEAAIYIEIPEPFDTLEENARTKSQTIYTLTGEDCFSEDTGLEVYALNGEPGVKSARYAGENKNSADNIELLLKNLAGKNSRLARFKTVLSLLQKGVEKQFIGICEGAIIAQPTGHSGFGYDPVFIPTGANKTFAEMRIGEKNIYSHRQKAITQLLSYISLSGK